MQLDFRLDSSWFLFDVLLIPFWLILVSHTQKKVRSKKAYPKLLKC